jgi:pimeloyl-ACP methyl ester carboxylesterase
MLGHETLGTGPTTVIVMNDWLCDTSTWDDARAYLDGARFTWVFADLRGYGRSKQLAGQFTLTEAAADVIALADALQCRSFALVGHSCDATRLRRC